MQSGGLCSCCACVSVSACVSVCLEVCATLGVHSTTHIAGLLCLWVVAVVVVMVVMVVVVVMVMVVVVVVVMVLPCLRACCLPTHPACLHTLPAYTPCLPTHLACLPACLRTPVSACLHTRPCLGPCCSTVAPAAATRHHFDGLHPDGVHAPADVLGGVEELVNITVDLVELQNNVGSNVEDAPEAKRVHTQTHNTRQSHAFGREGVCLTAHPNNVASQNYHTARGVRIQCSVWRTTD